MKKLLMALAFAGVALGANAQDADHALKYSVATNSFWSNWFVQGNLAGSAFWGNQEVGNDFAKSPFEGFRNNLGFSVAVGKWFTPGLGLRTKFNGVWGRSVVSEDKKTNADKYWTLNEQVLFNLSNMLCGYSETRVWNFIPYAGVGVNRNMSANAYAPVFGAGILNEFKLNKKWAINLDVNYALSTSDYDGFTGLLPNAKPEDGHSVKEKTPDVDAIKALSQSQIDALNAQLNDANSENTRLKNMLAEEQKNNETQKATKAFVNTPVSVFFNINKAKIASQKDLVNVKALAKYAKENNLKLAVTGYADGATGSAAYNQTLSEKRAATVADQLVKMGVSRDMITTVGKGGVDELSPISFNRRATVQVAE